MAQLSESELDIVSCNPIKDEFKALLTTIKSTYPNAKVANSSTNYEKLLADPVGKDLVLRFIGTLLLLPAASALPSKYGLGPLSGDIALLYSGLSSSQIDIKITAALLHVVIWTVLYAVIARTRPTPQPTTPPLSRPSFTSSFQQTPWSFNTGGFEDTSEHRKQVDDVLKEELLPSLRIDIPDFIDAVFRHVPQLDELAEAVFELCLEGDTPLYKEGGGWARWPGSAKEELVLEWLQDLMKRFTAWINECGVHSAAHRRIYQGPGIYLDGSPVKRKMDVGIIACHGQSKSEDDGNSENTDASIPNWTQIMVAGELKSNPIEDKQEPAWLDLARYAREVFRSQDRRFVLGFTLCGSIMRLWQFDRSGSSGSFSFDTNRDGLRFVHVMLGFYLMNDEQLGLDPTIQPSDGKRYVEITRSDQVERLILTEEIIKQAVIVGRATTCWKAYRDGDGLKEPLIVKDSWQYEERPEEGELIKEATDKGVRNIARYYYHETVQVGGKNDDTIENVRRGLMKACGRTTFRQKSSNKPEAPTSESLGKSVAGQTQSQSRSRKRSSSSAQMAPPASNKRSCSSLQSRNSERPIHNRIHRRVITRDTGKIIQEASSRIAILNGLIGAIEGEDHIMTIKNLAYFVLGHESLLDAGILHHDISTGNILLTEKEDDGFLIDFDLAIKMDNDKASGAPNKTGTKFFMAIGALKGEHHNSMHDWGSFFWVLFWICIHWNGPCQERRKVKEFEEWNKKPIKELAEIKIGKVSEEDGFDEEMSDNFSKYCKPLIPCMQELRKVVFPGGKRWLSEDRELYSRIVAVLQKARESPNVLAIPSD
ncbi:hypothetical protein MMC13_001805 [Lambiella insularis]|nr:hypothetical protein [Lambiella insularis]